MTLAYNPKIRPGSAFSESQDIKVFSSLVETMYMFGQGDYLGASVKLDGLADREKRLITDAGLDGLLEQYAKSLESQNHLFAMKARKAKARQIKTRLLIALICKIDNSYHPQELKGSKLSTLEKLALNKAKAAGSDMLDIAVKINFLTT